MIHEDVTSRIIRAALRVHTAFGAGMLESTYDACLHYQFSMDGLRFEHHVKLPIVYHSVQLDAAYRIDYLVENCVIVELKAVEKLLPVHTAQLISYLKLSNRRVGLLINFNVPHLRDGIKRIISGYDHQQGSVSVSSVSSAVESLLSVASLPDAQDKAGH